MATDGDNEVIKAMREVALSPKDAVNSEEYIDDNPPVDLERLFLTPDNKFSEQWLNKLQQ
jgi:hypothetical protein